MFYPKFITTYKAKGKIRFKPGRPAANQEVILYAGGKRYRTITDSRGQYLFPGQSTGQIEVEVKGLLKQCVPASKQLDFTLPD